MHHSLVYCCKVLPSWFIMHVYFACIHFMIFQTERIKNIIKYHLEVLWALYHSQVIVGPTNGMACNFVNSKINCKSFQVHVLVVHVNI